MTVDIFKFLVLKVIVLGSAEPFFYALYDNHNPSSPDLSQITNPVATTSGQKSANVCQPPKNALPLPTQTSNNACHCKTRSITIKNYKIMKQMNEMSARALSMEELENVNGGGKHLNIRRGHGV